MGKPKTLLEGLCGHAASFGATSISVTRKDGSDWVFAQEDGVNVRIFRCQSSSADSKELRQNLAAAAKKPVRTVVEGQLFILNVRVRENSGEEAFDVAIDPAPERDPSTAPSFTPKQAQYLAYIHYYSKTHRQSPAESDLQRYFRVSPPAVHEMIKTLERNGLIRRTPGQARSIQLLVRPEHLPALH
jgi:repressor LexA